MDKKIIDAIVWWIPNKKLRNSLKALLTNSNVLLENNKEKLVQEYYRECGYTEIRPIGFYESPYPPKNELIDGINKIKDGTSFMYDMKGINTNDKYQLDFYEKISPYFETYKPHKDKSEDSRFYYNNVAFGYDCGRYLHAVINYLKPRNIIEIGSGYSTALMLDINDAFFNSSINFLCIEPFPSRLKNLLYETDNINIMETIQQNVKTEVFSILEENDLLFIDSSHVCRAFGDINRQFFDILPSLKKGVIIHLHDIIYPFEYPERWLLNGWAFTEAYMLRSFLQYNDTFEILLFPSYIYNKYGNKVKFTNGSIFLRKIK